MDDFTKEETKEALGTIESMIGRTEKAEQRFARDVSQHTLQKNRLKALHIASSLLAKRLAANDDLGHHTEKDLKSALAPIASLISKSEKARGKLAQSTWQHTMLSDNLKALHMALGLLTTALNEINARKQAN